MGWTWKEYEDTPSWFIDVLLHMLTEEATAQRNKAS